MSLRSARRVSLGRGCSGRSSRAAVGIVAVVLLAGCGSGQKAEVYQEHTVSDATNANVGAIAIRNLAIDAPTQGSVLPEGSDAPMTVTLINDSETDDVLLSASTPAATSVNIVGPGTTVPVPRLSTASSDYSLVLVNLTRDLPAGTYINLTLNFKQNGTQTMLVPVETTPDGAPRPTGTYQVPDTDSANSPIVSSPATE